MYEHAPSHKESGCTVYAVVFIRAILPSYAHLCKYSSVLRAAKVRYDDPLDICTTGITCRETFFNYLQLPVNPVINLSNMHHILDHYCLITSLVAASKCKLFLTVRRLLVAQPVG